MTNPLKSWFLNLKTIEIQLQKHTRHLQNLTLHTKSPAEKGTTMALIQGDMIVLIQIITMIIKGTTRITTHIEIGETDHINQQDAGFTINKEAAGMVIFVGISILEVKLILTMKDMEKEFHVWKHIFTAVKREGTNSVTIIVMKASYSYGKNEIKGIQNISDIASN